MTPQLRSFIADLAERTGITTSELIDMFRKYQTKRTPVKKCSGKGSRVGKLGTVRLKGADMTRLREQAYDRARGRCEVKLPHSCPGSVAWELGDLAHIRNRRMYGDVLSNVWWACREGHRVAMHNPKPCPTKVHGGVL